MAAASAAGVIDPTKTGKYPVILSDALLGKSAKEIYTGVRYNHKPALSSDTAPATARLKPSSSNGAYDLSFTDDGGRYAYSGSRSSTPDSSNGSSPFVLIFDPARQAFVLHRVDSVFNMNLTRTPGNTDPEALREEFPHLNSTIKVQVGGGGSSSNASKSGASTATSSSSAPLAARNKPAGEKSGMRALAKLKEHQSKTKKAAEKERKEPPAPISVPEPLAKAEKVVKRRDRSPVDSDEDEDEDDDGGLLIEYPEGEAPPRFQAADFSPAFPVKPFADFVQDREDEQDDDADGEEEFDVPDVPEDDDDEEEEEEDEPMGTFKLPSPVGQQNQQDAGADDDDDIEDLEAALEKEFAMDSESSVSEED